MFHATAIYASDGMVLSGDDLTTISPPRLAMLRKLLPPTGTAAQFESDALDVGVVRLSRGRGVCLFNWSEQPRTFTAPIGGTAAVKDFWSGESLGRHEGSITIRDVPPHGARLLIVEDV